jgi:hypothetical protein
LLCLPLYIICFFSLTASNILSLFSVLVALMIICYGEVLFWSSLSGVLKASYTWMGKIFLRFGKFSVIILLNILCIPLSYTSSPSSMPMIFRFGLLMESLSSFMFFLYLLICLTKICSVFSLIYSLSLSSEVLSSTCFVCWSGLLFD